MKKSKIFLLFIYTISFISYGCGNKDDIGNSEDKFDRQKMLMDWADLIIIPSFQAYTNTLNELEVKKDIFLANKNIESLQLLKEAYLKAYIDWQKVSMFDIGKAEAIGLRNFTNIYPTDVDLILKNINTSSYNLNLPSNFDAQGFPALDYLLYGLAEKEEDQVNILVKTEYASYLNDLIVRLNQLTNEVLLDWESTYRTIFINNTGGGATASVDKLVNDYLFYYEKYLRAGKIGIPIGIFSENPIPNAVEAPYSKIYSKTLFLESLKSAVKFFIGKSYDESKDGISLKDYLNSKESNGQMFSLSSIILDHWDIVLEQANLINDNFKEQIVIDNNAMLSIYDELQKATVLLKVDMMQALNIQVDYVDADGD